MKYYDIRHIGKGRWKTPVTLQLSGGPARGYMAVSLVPGKVLESIPEEQLTDQVHALTKKKRERPPLVELKEIDHDARLAAKEKELEVTRERGRKKLEKKLALEVKSEQPTEKELPLEETLAPKKSKKSKRKKDTASELTEDEQKALEEGSELPSSFDS